MSIRVFIKRHIKKNSVEKVISLLKEFRAAAVRQPGYISGETLINHYDRQNMTIVSSWETLEDWMRWQNSEERAANEAKIEQLLESTTKYEIYDVGSCVTG
jgi:heme-degrading monooxygenase HmoA